VTNKALWDRVCITDPKAVKPITGKQYKGNSPKPYWIVERLTEEFGPCGIGWGFTILNERMERLTDSDVLHVAVVRLWYVMDGKRGELEQIGQTKAVYEKSAGGFMVDEDAPKKSVTDALVKCASYLGFAGDIFAGRWDDSRYVESARQHYAEPPPPPPAKKTGVMADVLASLPALTPEESEYYTELAFNVTEAFAAGGGAAALEVVNEAHMDNDEKMYLWARLDSKVRSGLKAEQAKQPVKVTP
jgi:hypothetical protein